MPGLTKCVLPPLPCLPSKFLFEVDAHLSSGFNLSAFIAMNADKLKPEERCASTSNRNFEGRQGRGGRTHLVSPGMAAAAAIS